MNTIKVIEFSNRNATGYAANYVFTYESEAHVFKPLSKTTSCSICCQLSGVAFIFLVLIERFVINCLLQFHCEPNYLNADSCV